MSIEGQVRNERDLPIRGGVTVSIVSRDGRPIVQQPANYLGWFEIPNLRRDVYTLTVSAEGFYSIQQSVDLRPVAGPRFFLRLVLTAREGQSLTPDPPPALTDLRAPRKARQEYDRGRGAMREGKYPEAEAHFDRAVKAFPCYARAQTELGMLLAGRNEFGAAEAALNKAVECDAGLPDAYLDMAAILSFEKKFQETVALLQQGLRRFPRAWQFYDQLAIADFNMGRFAQAEEEWVKVGSLNPSPPADIHAKLAAVYWRLRNSSKAYAEMTAYLRAEPEGRYAGRIKDLMQAMESGPSAGKVQAPELPLPGPP